MQGESVSLGFVTITLGLMWDARLALERTGNNDAVHFVECRETMQGTEQSLRSVDPVNRMTTAVMIICLY